MTQVAFRHADDADPTTVPNRLVTASVDRLDIRRKIPIDRDLHLSGNVSWVGSSSMCISLSLAGVRVVHARDARCVMREHVRYCVTRTSHIATGRQRRSARDNNEAPGRPVPNRFVPLRFRGPVWEIGAGESAADDQRGACTVDAACRASKLVLRHGSVAQAEKRMFALGEEAKNLRKHERMSNLETTEPLPEEVPCRPHPGIGGYAHLLGRPRSFAARTRTSTDSRVGCSLRHACALFAWVPVHVLRSKTIRPRRPYLHLMVTAPWNVACCVLRVACVSHSGVV
jgi:hypothetical protein